MVRAAGGRDDTHVRSENLEIKHPGGHSKSSERFESLMKFWSNEESGAGMNGGVMKIGVGADLTATAGSPRDVGIVTDDLTEHLDTSSISSSSTTRSSKPNGYMATQDCKCETSCPSPADAVVEDSSSRCTNRDASAPVGGYTAGENPPVYVEDYNLSLIHI